MTSALRFQTRTNHPTVYKQRAAPGGQPRAAVPTQGSYHRPLRPGFCNFREDFAFFFRRAAEVMFGQASTQKLEYIFGAVDDLELVEVFGGNGAGVDEGLKVQDAVPVLAAVDDDQDFLGQLVGLREREDLEEFVHGAETAGENDESLGEIGEPEFAHEEVMELEVQRGSDVLVGTLLERQLDIQADRLSSGFVGAEVGGFHNAGTSAGGDDEAAAAGGDLNGPRGQHVREAARVLVVAGHIDGGLGRLQICFQLSGRRGCTVLFERGEGFGSVLVSLKAGRTEKDDGVLNLLAAEARQGLLIFGEDAEDAPVGAAEERFVLVGYGRGF